MRPHCRVEVGGLRCGRGLLVLLLGPLSHQVIAQAPESTLRVNVDVVTVEVAVTNKESQHFPRLTKDDFRLWLDGQEQKIQTADEVQFGVAGEKSRRVKVQLILFNDSLSTMSKVPASRQAAKIYITRHMNRGDLAAVVVHGATVRIIQNFTSDTAKVIEAIDRSMRNAEGSQPGLASPGLEGSTPRVDPAVSERTLAVGSGQPNLSQTLNLLSSSMLRIMGRKAILVFASSSGNGFQPFEPRPDAQARYH